VPSATLILASDVASDAVADLQIGHWTDPSSEYRTLTIDPAPHSPYSPLMPLSARNKLTGRIEEIHLGGVMAHVVVRIGNDLIESVITRRSAEELHLQVGDTVRAIVKSTEVMLEKG